MSALCELLPGRLSLLGKAALSIGERLAHPPLLFQSSPINQNHLHSECHRLYVSLNLVSASSIAHLLPALIPVCGVLLPEFCLEL